MATKRKDGRLQTSVTITNPLTGEKKKKYIYAYTAEDLAKERTRVLSEAENIIDNSIKLSSYGSEILKRKRSEGLSPISLELYEKDFNKFIKPTIGALKLSQITPLIIRLRFLDKIQSKSLRKRAFNLLRMILNQAYYDELIDKNPCGRIRLPSNAVNEKKIITDEMYKKLLQATIDTYSHEMYILAHDTGMRRGEIAALTWQQISLNDDKPTIKIDRSMKYVHKEKIIGKTKTIASNREILLPDSVIEALKRQRTRQEFIAMRNNRILKESDFVFTTEKYNAISTSVITGNFCKNKKRANITENISFHSFRHTHATILMQNGLSEKAIAKRLGHTSFVFTFNRYTHSTDTAQENILDFLNNQDGLSNKMSKIKK